MESSRFLNRRRRRRLLLEQLEDRSLLAADAAIFGTKWEDLNGNSARDSGEPPLAGVTIYLDINDNGSRDAGELFTTTDSGGAYAFPALEAGSYTVREEVPADYQRTFPRISGARLFTTDTTTGSLDRILEVNPVTGAVIRAILAPVAGGSTTTGLAFDGQTLYFLSDTNDTLYRLNPDSGVILSTMVLPSRSYGGLAAAGGFVYALDSSQEDILRLDRNTGALLATLDINAINPGLSLNDGLGEVVSTGELVGVNSSGIVFLNPVTGVQTGTLTVASPSLVKALTSVGGELFLGYGFSNRIDVLSRSGTLLRSFGTNYTVVGLGGWGDASGAHRVTLAAGQTAMNVDFGNQYTLVDIRGTKWEDLDGDGLRDAGEPPMAGVTIYLDTNDNANPDSGEPITLTGADGSYAFLDQQPGSYVVREIAPAAYRQTSPGISSNRLFAVDSAVNPDQIVELHPVGGATLRTLPAPVPSSFGTFGLAFDKETLYFLADSSSSDILYELDPGTGVVLDSTILPLRSYSGLAALHGQVYLLDSSGDDILRFDPVADTITATLDINALNPGVNVIEGLGEIDASGELIVVSSGNVLLLNAETGLRTTMFPVGSAFSIRGVTSLDGQILVSLSSNRIDVYSRSGVLVRTISTLFTGQALGGADRIDGAHRLHLAPAENAGGIDFGNQFNLAEIRGSKWEDLDGDAQRDPDEPPMAGVVVYVDANDNGTRDPGEPNTTTASDGTYVLPDVTAGPTVVREERPANYHQTFPQLSATRLFAIDSSSFPARIVELSQATGAVQRALPMPPGSGFTFSSLAYSDNTLYVLGDSFSADRLFEIDPDSGLVRESTLLPSRSYGGLAVLNGKLYALESSTKTVVVFDPETNSVVTTLTLTAGAGSLSLLSALGEMVSTNELIAATSSGVAFFNPETGAQTGSFVVPSPFSIAGLAGIQNEIFVNATSPNRIQVYNRAGTLLRTLNVAFSVAALGAGGDTSGAQRFVLAPGSVAANIDFANQFSLVDIQGTKWNDNDGDGVRDPAETPLAGVVIYLDSNNNGSRDADEPSTMTAADGSYGFLDLQPGDYVVREEVPAGFQPTSPRSPVGRLFAVDWLTSPDRIVELNPASGQIINTIPTPATFISSRSGLAFDGATLYFMSSGNTLYELNPDTGFVLDSTVLPSGNYSGLAAMNGKVYVHEWAWDQELVFDPISDLVLATLDIEVPSASLPVDEGLGEFGPTGELVALGAGTAIFFDAATGRRTGSFPIGDSSFPKAVTAIGDEIYISKESPNRIEVYSRDGRLLRQHSTTFAAVGLAGSGVVVFDGHRLSLDAAENVAGIDFGNQSLFAEIRGTKWEDLDADGTRDAGEPPLGGIVVYLDANDNGVLDAAELWTTSAADGGYAFTGLAPGDYVVREISSVNFAQTSPSQTKDRLFVADTFDKLIVEIDPATGSILNSFAAPGSQSIFQGIAFDGTTLFFLDGISSKLYELDPDTGAIRDATQLTGSGYDGLATIGGLVYVKLSNSFIAVFNPATNTLLPNLTLKGFATGFLTDGFGEISGPDRLLAKGLGGDFLQIDPQTGAVSASWIIPNWASVYGIASLRQEVFVGDTSGRIDVYSRAGDLLRSLTGMPAVFGLAASAGAYGAHRLHLEVGEVANGLDFGNERLNTPPIANAGGPYSVGEGGTVVLTGLGSTDPDQPAETLVYAWDLDGDDIFGEVGAAAERGDEHGPNPVFSAAGLDGPTTLSVRLRVTDSFAQVDDSAAMVEVINVAPADLVLNAATIDENGTYVLQGSFTDPGPDSHTVTVDWGPGEGSTTMTLPPGARTFTLSHPYLDDDPPGSPQDVYAVSVSVTDDDLATVAGGATATVVNLPPVIESLSSTAACCDTAIGETVQIVGSFTDVGTLDTHTVLVDWGDGTSSLATVTEAGGSGTFAADHAYATGGVFTITVTAVDDDSGTDIATALAFVSGVRLTSSGDLQVVGTTGRDHVLVRLVSGGSSPQVKVIAGFDVTAGWDEANGQIFTFAADDVHSLTLWLGEGDDHASIGDNGVASEFLPAATIDGGGGNDHLLGSGGDDVLLGGLGNDTVYGRDGNDSILGGEGDDRLDGGRGRDVIIGGLGADELRGNQEDDVLIAGFTAFDDDAAALALIASEWNSSDDYLTRIDHLRNGTGAILSGSGVTLVASEPARTVFDDGSRDILFGNQALDWFFADVDDDEEDEVRDDGQLEFEQ